MNPDTQRVLDAIAKLESKVDELTVELDATRAELGFLSVVNYNVQDLRRDMDTLADEVRGATEARDVAVGGALAEPTPAPSRPADAGAVCECLHAEDTHTHFLGCSIFKCPCLAFAPLPTKFKMKLVTDLTDNDKVVFAPPSPGRSNGEWAKPRAAVFRWEHAGRVACYDSVRGTPLRVERDTEGRLVVVD